MVDETVLSVFNLLNKLKTTIEKGKDHVLSENLFHKKDLVEIRNRVVPELGVNIPDFEDEFRQINCKLMKVNMVGIQSNLYFEISIPT